MFEIFSIICYMGFYVYVTLAVIGIVCIAIMIAAFVANKELRKETYNTFVEEAKEYVVFGKEIVDCFRG